MSMYQDKNASLRETAEFSPEEVAATMREAHRLRSQAVASVAAALARRLRRALRGRSPGGRPKAVVGPSL